MFSKVRREQVERAIKLTKDGTSTGIDRCLYELWKVLKNKHETNKKNEKPTFDIVKTMTMVFEDIQTNGI